MSIGPMGSAAISAAGVPLTQAHGTETDRLRQASAAQQRQTAGDASAEQAAGIGQASQDQEASERDADGRRLWEKSPTGSDPAAELRSDQDESQGRPPPDPRGESGSTLDLTA